MNKNTWIIAATVLLLAIIVTTAITLKTRDIDPQSQTTGPVNSGVIAGEDIPEPTGYVNDNANLLQASDKTTLESQLSTWVKDGHGELAILTTPSMNGLSVEEYGIRVAEKWKVGAKGIDNGIIMIIALQERKVRIEVGRGAEITDAQAQHIIDSDMIPKLKLKDWNGAVKDGTNALITLMNK